MLEAATPPTSPYRRTHGLAVASLVCALFGFCCWIVFPAAGLVLALIARADIRQRPDEWTGEGLAALGLVLSIVLLALQVIGLVLLFVLGLNPDRISALLETPPAEVFYENNLPRDGVEFLRGGGFIRPDEHVLLYYDDSFLEKFAALSVLTNQRVLTVFDGVASSVRLPEVTRVRYVPGTPFEDYIIHVHARDGRQLALIFTHGADVRGFAERLAEEVRRAGGPEIQVE